MGSAVSALTSKCLPEYGKDDEILSEEKSGQQSQQPEKRKNEEERQQQQQQQTARSQENDEAIFKVTDDASQNQGQSTPPHSAIVEESYGMTPLSQKIPEKQKNKDNEEDDIFKDMEPEIKRPLTIQTQKSLPQTSDRLRLEITQEDQEDTSAWD